MAKRRAKISQDFFSPTAPDTEETELGEVLEEVVPETTKPEVQEQPAPTTLPKATPQPRIKTSNSQTVKTSNSQSSSAEKQQVTVYLNPMTVDQITITQLQLKRLTGLRGHSLSNSAIVEAALQVVFNDLKAAGKNSLLAQYLQAAEG